MMKESLAVFNRKATSAVMIAIFKRLSLVIFDRSIRVKFTISFKISVLKEVDVL